MLSDHCFIESHLTILQLIGAIKVTSKRKINKMDKSAFKDDLKTELQSIQSKASNIDELIYNITKSLQMLPIDKLPRYRQRLHQIAPNLGLMIM